MNATQLRPTRLRRGAAVAALLAVPPLASCSSTNFDAQTDQYYTPTDGDNSREGTVDVLHTVIVSEEAGTGRLIAGLANGNTEEETEVTGVEGLEEDQALQFRLVEGETTIPAGGLLQLADEDAAVIAVSGDPELLAPGKYVRLAISFDNGEEAQLNVPVLAPGADYADVEIPEATTGDADPTPSEG